MSLGSLSLRRLLRVCTASCELPRQAATTWSGHPSIESRQQRTSSLVRRPSARRFTFTWMKHSSNAFDNRWRSSAPSISVSACIVALIFSNRIYDVGEYYNFGSIFDAINTVCQNKSKGIASEYEKKASAFTKALDKWVEEIEGLE